MSATEWAPDELQRLLDTQVALAAMQRYWPTPEEHASTMRQLRPAYEFYTSNVSVAAHAASLETAALLLWLCRNLKARRCLDLGSGFSTFVVNLWAAEAQFPVDVLSVDHDPMWMAKTQDFVPGATLVDWETFDAAEHEPFDVIFHDLASGDLRNDALARVAPLIAPGGVIVLDDAQNDSHREVFWNCGLDVYSAHDLTRDRFERFAMLGFPKVTGPTFHEDWFCEESRNALAAIARGLKDVPGAIIEIGSWEGRSTIALANAAHPRPVHACDTWQGSPGEPSATVAAQRDIYATWRANVDELTAGNVIEHRCDWREWLPDFDEPIALVFIDAEHTYREVYDTIQCVLPKMAPGGVICGDDSHHPPVRQAVFDTLGEADTYVAASLWLWQNLNDPKPQPTLLEMYAERCATPSDIWEHLPILANLAKSAQHVVELGARTGVSTVAWLYGLQESGGRLTSVDLSPAPTIGYYDNWLHIQGDDMDPAIFDRVDDCDVLFIDTSHHYAHTLWELRNWSRKVKPGGVIVCHDTELQRPSDPPCPPTDPDFPVKRAIEKFIAETGWEWKNIPTCWGLGIIKVR